MAYGYIKLDSVAAKNVDSYNLNFINETTDIQNGGVFNKSTISTAPDSGEVFTTTGVLTTASNQTYMAAASGDVILTDTMGGQYKIGLNDPRKYQNVKGIVFNGFKPQLGDRVTLTLDAISGTKPATMDTTVYLVCTDGAYKLSYGTAVGVGLTWQLVKRNDISIGMTGQISGSNRVEAYQFECVQV